MNEPNIIRVPESYFLLLDKVCCQVIAISNSKFALQMEIKRICCGDPQSSRFEVIQNGYLTLTC